MSTQHETRSVINEESTDLHGCRNSIEFHAETLDLHLVVDSAQVLEGAIRAPSAKIARVKHIASAMRMSF